MAERLIRLGKVSSIDAENGMVSVTYPDLDDNTTGDFPVLSFNDEYKMPKVGDNVLVLHLSNGQSAGVVLGHYWNESNTPPVSSGYRKEFSKSEGEGYARYVNGRYTIHADEIVLDGNVTVNGTFNE